MTVHLRFLGRLVRHRYMIESMVRHDLKSRYAGSFLGLGWSLLFPLCMFATYYFMFNVVLNVGPGKGYEDMPFSLWLLCGLLPWLLVSEVLSRSSGLLVDKKNLITKNVFPSEMLPVISVLGALVHHLAALLVLLAVMAVFGLPLTPALTLLPAYVLAAVILSLGLAWFLSSLTVFLRDLGQIVGVVVLAWSVATPIMYPVDRVPPALMGLYRLNPLMHLVDGYRAALLGRVPVGWGSFGYLVSCCLVLALVGGTIFRRLKPAFADVL
jgi:ABC-type polysaccharide/polyol phosphate export permease